VAVLFKVGKVDGEWKSVWRFPGTGIKKTQKQKLRSPQNGGKEVAFPVCGDAKRDCGVPYLMGRHVHERSGVLWWLGGRSEERQLNPPLYIQSCSLEFGNSISQPVVSKCQLSELLGKIIKSCILGA
jgi:hypothetical protein